MYIRELLMVLGAYALGSFSTGYYLVRHRTGRDIRLLGSGSAGSRNVARSIGLTASATTLAADVAKGSLAVGVAVLLGLETWAVMLVVGAVVAGHIWPPQLQFRGGKGLATFMGTALVFDYVLVLIAVAVAAVTLALTRRITLSGLVAVVLTPLAAVLMGRTQVEVVGLSALAAIILLSHRDNIHSLVKGSRSPSGEGG